MGAVGTAALLNVGSSLNNLLKELKGQGYSVGGSGFGLGPLDGGHSVLHFVDILLDSFCFLLHPYDISLSPSPNPNSIFTPTLPLI